MLSINLSERVAIVTGSTRGIGLACARALRDAGAAVLVCGRDAGTVAERSAELGGASVAHGLALDISEPDSASRLVDAALQRWGRLDILVNNAVTSVQNTFEGLSDDDWALHLNSKLTAYVRMCRAALPHLQASGRGRIVMLAGLSARQVTDFRITNGAVNAAVANLGKHLAQQYARKGVTVNVIHPGLTWTQRLETGLQRWAQLDGISLEEEQARREAEMPIGRFIRPEEIANVVAFLSSGLADAVTGQAIAVDGGSCRGIAY